VLHSPLLATALAGAFDGAMEPLRADALVSALAQGLLAAASSPQAAAGPGAGPGRSGATAARSMDAPAVQRACEYLSAHCLRVVRSEELERVSGLSRFELALQFRRRHGTSPYRYLLMRRLDHVQARLRHGAVLADLAAEAGFADQAHMTRMFKAAFGLTPRQFAAMHHVPVAEPD
jgi:AraC-like DNA-binding protein